MSFQKIVSASTLVVYVPPTSMTTWHQLPFEIQDQILYFFSLQVINEYKQLGVDPWKEENASVLELNFDWPHQVACLQHFSWALCVSRYFNNALNSVIKIEDETPVEMLQMLQYHRVCEILNGLEAYGERSTIHFAYVLLFLKLAGYYLKNKLIIDSFYVIRRILTEFRFNSCWVLIPRLKEWLDRHATENRCSHFKTVRVGVWDEDHEGDGVGKLMSFKLGNRMLGGEGFSATTIERVASEGDIEICSNCHQPHVFVCDTKMRMVQDIMQSERNSWWIFHMHCFDEDEEDEQWYLVNYTLGKIYRGPDGSGGCYWDVGCWDPYMWRGDEESDDEKSPEDKQEYEQDVAEVITVEKDGSTKAET